MKHAIQTIAFHLSLFALHLSLPAAVPVSWTVDTSRVNTYQIDAYHGETLELEASFFQSDGKPLAITGPAELYYQTNGMGAAWWTAPATVASNTISATFTPAIDPGARVLTCFLGGTASNYRAAFRLRFGDSPGATPNLLPLPTVTYDARLNGAPTINGTNLIDYVVAASGAEVDPTVPAWAKQPNPPQSGTDENAVRAIVGSFASTGTVSRASSVGDAEQWTDAAGFVWRYYRDWTLVSDDYGYSYGDLYWSDDTPYGMAGWWITIGEAPYFDFSHGRDSSVVTFNVGTGQNLVFQIGTNIVGRIALTNDVPSNPGDIGAAPAAVADTVQAWQTYWDGDDVRVTVTNYYGSIDIPHLYIEQRMPADETHDAAWFKIIWDEMTRHQQILQRITEAESAIAEKADRAWGFYDSHTGEYSPDGYTQISSSNILIAAGMAYQKTITTDGEVWVLTATEPTTVSGATSNGFFRISDGDGNSLFEIVKGDKRTVGATAGGITVDENFVHITYSVVSDDPPQIEMTQDLRNGNWSQLSAAVSWTGQSGAWVANVEKPNQPRAFFRATYRLGSETYIKNSAPVGFERVYIGGQSYRVAVETINGKKLMVLYND